MQCTECGETLAADARFCGSCQAVVHSPPPALISQSAQRPGQTALPAPGAPETAATGSERPRNCIFLGCQRRGVLTQEDRCPLCGRETFERLVPTSDAAAANASQSTTFPVLQPRTSSALNRRLATDAARVGGIFEMLSWLVVALGVIGVVVVFLGAIIEKSPLSAFLGAGLVAVYTLMSWAFMMLASVLARYIQHRVG